MTSASERLTGYLSSRGLPVKIEQLTPDASTREYFRIEWKNGPAVACVYPEAFGEDLPFLDTTELFESAAIPVAGILDKEASLGIVIQQDLGERPLSDVLSKSGEMEKEALIDEAIRLIARIQAATPLAFERASVASRRRFDRIKLGWELGFFFDHHFQSLIGRSPDAELESRVRNEFDELAAELENYSKHLVHRDFHAANLMVGTDGELFLIDHQDARLGSAAYDLVSLLLDRVTEPPEEDRLEQKRALLLSAREKLGLERLGSEAFSKEFSLVAIQRCLKAIGTFSNQVGNFGRSRYTAYIDPMFRIVEDTCRNAGRFPAVIEMIHASREFRK